MASIFEGAASRNGPSTAIPAASALAAISATRRGARSTNNCQPSSTSSATNHHTFTLTANPNAIPESAGQSRDDDSRAAKNASRPQSTSRLPSGSSRARYSEATAPHQSAYTTPPTTV